jgi:hypothetical protein
MSEPFRWDLEHISQKCGKYWQSVVLFGLPFIVLYRGIDYAIFYIIAKRIDLPYPWRHVLAMDIPLMFVVSAIWWGLMRQLVAWKRKNQGNNSSSNPGRLPRF